MAVSCVFFDPGADEKQKSPVFDLHQPSQGLHLCNMAVGYVFCGLGADVKQKPLGFKNQTSQGLHQCNMAVGYICCDLGVGVNR